MQIKRRHMVAKLAQFCAVAGTLRPDPGSPAWQAALVLLTADYLRTTDPTRLATFAEVDPATVSAWAVRWQAQGVWRGDVPDSAVYWEEYGAAGLMADALCGLGMLRRTVDAFGRAAWSGVPDGEPDGGGICASA